MYIIISFTKQLRKLDCFKKHSLYDFGNFLFIFIHYEFQEKKNPEYVRVYDDFQFVVKLPPMSPLQVIVFWFAVFFSTWYEVLPNVVIPSRIQDAVLIISDRSRAVTIVLIDRFKFIVPQL